jgi:hypothetical protein
MWHDAYPGRIIIDENVVWPLMWTLLEDVVVRIAGERYGL